MTIISTVKTVSQWAMQFYIYTVMRQIQSPNFRKTPNLTFKAEENSIQYLGIRFQDILNFISSKMVLTWSCCTVMR